MSLQPIITPPGIQGAGAISAIFLPGGFEDLFAPTVEEATGQLAQRLAPWVWSDQFGEDVAESTQRKRRLSHKNSYEVFQGEEWSLSEFGYVADPQHPESITHQAAAALQPGLTGDVLMRWGLPEEVAWSASDIVNVFPVRLGAQRFVTPAEGDELTILQRAVVTGPVARMVPLLAA